ncbi:uncharacterized protein LOC141529609 isoform X2 [Cotesia typhae]|uniref:uncharacterized protein LOC141529609 isoform X2 n=1 Tax=Cotesia typhae TaxID=2053667 RepID=UPI003D683BCE
MALKREEEEKKEQEQQNKYRNVTTRRSNKWLTTRNELDVEQSQSKQPIVVNSDDDESSMMGKEEISSDEDTSTGYKNVQCPLCNKYFTTNKIESHADQCASISDNVQKHGIQSEENTEVSKTSPLLLTCQNCNNFRTRDRKIFEAHCSYECDQILMTKIL